jgi:hypothetical protein
LAWKIFPNVTKVFSDVVVTLLIVLEAAKLFSFVAVMNLPFVILKWVCLNLFTPRTSVCSGLSGSLPRNLRHAIS